MKRNKMVQKAKLGSLENKLLFFIHYVDVMSCYVMFSTWSLTMDFFLNLETVYSLFFWNLSSKIVTNTTFSHVIILKVGGRNGVTVKREKVTKAMQTKVCKKYTCWTVSESLIKGVEDCLCRANQTGKLLPEPIWTTFFYIVKHSWGDVDNGSGFSTI